ncbi:hypothetical protein MEN95_26650, partial [Dolichospermum sp. ST_sed7]|nr:hypothetical protein [Dolichospermum sp. ST_sed7]
MLTKSHSSLQASESHLVSADKVVETQDKQFISAAEKAMVGSGGGSVVQGAFQSVAQNTEKIVTHTAETMGSRNGVVY